MRWLVLVLLALAGPAGAAEFGRPGDRVEGVRISRPTLIRVDAQTLITARGLRIDVAFDERGELAEIMLVMALDRTQVDRLRPPRFGVPLDEVGILMLDPDRPVLVFARATEAMIASLRARGVTSVTDLMELEGTDGFPPLLDLAGYEFADLVQELPPADEGGAP